MTLEKLNKIVKKNNIPENVLLMSDSGWECDPTDMDRVYYNSELNTIVFTQECGGSLYNYEKDSKRNKKK